ncbi:Ribonuclease H-like domain [Lasallia pustulata]|uniref:RNA-directed DNA polymerase n=1 Tax=Lasallia pustulata TaxID=136370 RepID=A0A1W5CRP4_9LECA|nr:Ribonuclease H-like domain [Lasallia pustulata]
MKYEAFKGLLIWDIATIGSAAIILGMPWLQQANPSIDWETRTVRIGTNTVGSHNEISTLAQIGIPAEYAEYEEMFKEQADHDALPEHQTWDHEIPIVPGKNPEKQPIYPISEAKLEVLRKYIDENKAKGFIQESTSPVGYPILFVQKKDGTQQRCVDYRKLNTITVKNSYPLPLISELQDRLQKAKWFTKLDVRQAYHQIRMKAGEEWKTAFRTRLGYFEYRVMPFGLTNAPASFQSYINNVLREDRGENRIHVRKVLTALQMEDLRLSLEKSEFHKQEIDFLGYIIRPGELGMDPNKIFNPELPTEVETDASDGALGACLGQQRDKKLVPVAFYSRKLAPTELNYEIHDKELLAIVDALKQWRVYLEGSKTEVKVYSDHKNLKSFTTTKVLNRRQVRWSEELTAYHFWIYYRKGSLNGQADALSRRANYVTDIPKTAGQILELIREALTKDKAMKDLCTPNQEPGSPFEYEDGILWFNGKCYVPKSARDWVIRTCHDDRVQGHQGIERTLDKVATHWYIPRARHEVEEYIQKCDKYQRSKHARHAPYGRLQPVPTINQPWKTIAFDFIVKLPVPQEPMTQQYYDTILVVTDKLTKYGKFVPYLEGSSAEELAYAFYKYIVTDHGLPTQIILDRDKLVQDNWVELLPVAQLAYNTAKNATIGCTLFYANYGFEADVKNVPRGLQPIAQKAKVKVEDLAQLHEQLHQDIAFASNRKKGPSLEEGDIPYLLQRNIRTDRPAKKLNHTKLGPFRIKKALGPDVYELELPKSMKIHPVFHITVLEPAHPSIPVATQVPTLETDNNDKEYVVEKVLQSQLVDGQLQYLVKWKGYSMDDNTWEPASQFTSKKVLQDFHRHHPEQPRTVMPQGNRTGNPPERTS